MKNTQLKICIFGGTFDPIHLGHTFIAQQVVQQLGIDKMFFLPCAQSPHKKASQYISKAQERFTMCKHATAHLPWAEVSDFDITTPPPSFSWRTAEYFRTHFPNAKLYWLMGTDQWNSLPSWNRVNYFTKLLDIIIHSRKGEPIDHEGLSCTTLTNIVHPASATSVRAQLENSQISPWLAPKVAAFIKENVLYTKSPLD